MAVERRATVPILLHGATAGAVAGIVFILAEMVMAVVMGAPVFTPLRLISTIVLGTGALAPTFPVASAVVVGLIVHLVLSAIFGVIFLYLLAVSRQLDAPVGMLLLYGSLYGLALWVVNFLIIAPIAFPQFTRVDQLWMGFAAHTFFYGTVIGGYAAAVRSGPAERPIR